MRRPVLSDAEQELQALQLLEEESDWASVAVLVRHRDEVRVIEVDQGLSSLVRSRDALLEQKGFVKVYRITESGRERLRARRTR